jgi:hypothetical protein
MRKAVLFSLLLGLTTPACSQRKTKWDELRDEAVALKTRACACKDAKCAMKVRAHLTVWGRRVVDILQARQDTSESAKQAIANTMHEVGECLARFDSE